MRCAWNPKVQGDRHRSMVTCFLADFIGLLGFDKRAVQVTKKVQRLTQNDPSHIRFPHVARLLEQLNRFSTRLDTFPEPTKCKQRKRLKTPRLSLPQPVPQVTVNLVGLLRIISTASGPAERRSCDGMHRVGSTKFLRGRVSLGQVHVSQMRPQGGNGAFGKPVRIAESVVEAGA